MNHCTSANSAPVRRFALEPGRRDRSTSPVAGWRAGYRASLDSVGSTIDLERIAVASEPKQVQQFDVDGELRDFVLEEAIRTDFALVHAEVGDRHGNLIFNKSARNFSPLAAMAGRVCVAQVERLVEPGELDPDCIHLPGVYVHRVLEVGTDIEKRVERRTVREA